MAQNNWRNYSELLAVFNYTATNNFSIKLNKTSLPTQANYIACVMWTDSIHTVHRYKLWENVGEKFFFNVPLYTQQLIKKNFRIEIWSVLQDSDTLILSNVVGPGVPNGEYVWLEAYAAWIGANGATDYSIRRVATGWQIWRLASHLYDNFNISDKYPYGNWYGYLSGILSDIEITIPNVASNDANILVQTSVLQSYDYRYAVDINLAGLPAIDTDLSIALPANLPLAFPVNSYPTPN